MKRFCCLLAAFLFAAAASEAQNPAVEDGYFTTSDGVRLHYLDAGSGPAIVFVPGWTNPAWIWEPQIEHFGENYRVVALDPRSQGESEQVAEGLFPERRAQDVKELMERLQLSPAVLVGFSMGVWEVLSYVDQFGTTTLRGVVLVDAGIGSDASMEQLSAFFDFVEEFNIDRQRAVEARFSAFNKPQPEGYRRRVMEAFQQIPTNTAVALLASYWARDWRPVLEKLDKPVLYAVTQENKSQGEMLQSRLPSAQVEFFPDAGHVLFADEPERFNTILEEFAQKSFGVR